MPQLDLAGFPPQIIWLVITFVILWLLMAKVALPRVGLVLEERQKKIDENLDLAETLRDEAQGAMDAYEKSISEAKDNARGSVAEAVRQVSDTCCYQRDPVRLCLVYTEHIPHHTTHRLPCVHQLPGAHSTS